MLNRLHWILATLIASVSFFAASMTAQAATYTVTSGDWTPESGTLLWAVAAANSNPGHDTIDLTGLPPNTLIAAEQELVIKDSVTIRADRAEYRLVKDQAKHWWVVLEGATLTLDGFRFNSAATPGGRLLWVHEGAAANLKNCQIRNFQARETQFEGNGGAIYVAGELLVESSILANNRSSLEGGAIYVAEGGYLAVTYSWFDGNQAYTEGGAIRLANPLDFLITRSTFSNNSADAGGALSIRNLARSAFTRLIAISTFSQNRARVGGAISIWQENVSVVSSTFWGNYADEWPSVRADHLEGFEANLVHFDPSSPQPLSCPWADGSGAYNIAVSGCQISPLRASQYIDQLPSNALQIDPRLRQHANFYSPSLHYTIVVPTHRVLASSSPVVDRIPNSSCYVPRSVLDQEGSPVVTHCDVGAVEGF